MDNPFLRAKFAFINWKRDFPVYIRRIELNPAFGRLDSAPAQECEHPYREGTALVVRIVGKHGLTVGIMNNHTDPSERAINARLLKTIRGTDGGTAYVQEVQAANPDAEWLRSHGIDPDMLIGVEDTIEPEA